MKKPFVRLAAAIVLFALPLQTVAAASMLFCGRVTHDTWLGHAVKALSEHDAGKAAPVGHEGEGDHHAEVAGHHHDADHGQVKHLAESCSACSDCCCPTALPSAEPPSAASVGTLALLIPSAVQPIPDSTPERLERPPRSNLV